MKTKNKSETIQVHQIGTSIRISDTHVAWLYPQKDGTLKVHEEYPITDKWIQEYRNCRVCGKKLSNMVFAFALWKFQKGICSTKCMRKEIVQRHACCNKAEQIGCVCMYAFTCPKHGETHIGTHD